jgi:hypothetical protein
MGKTFRLWNPEQTLLLPPSPVDWLPENHLVFFLLDLAAELDLGVPRQSPWPSVRAQVVAGDNLGAATRKVSHPAARSQISTGFS